MAESALSLEYRDFQREVAFLMGWERIPSNWNNTQLTDFGDIQKRALRQFYYPASTGEQPTYEWSFMRATGTVSLSAGDADYDLADDFSGTILDESVTHAASSERRPLKKISESSIRKLQSMDPQNGYPLYYAVRNKSHSPSTGQRWEMLVYPTPQATHTGDLTFRYVVLPGTLNANNKFPLGGARYSEVILASYLASAEYKLDDDPRGPFQERFNVMLQSAIRADMQLKENNRGGTS